MIDSIINSYKSYAGYLWQEILNPSWHNYFYWLIGVSAFFFFMEAIVPWRKKQSLFRQDFWLDFFYMFFNFFLFSLVIYNAASDVVVNAFNDGIKAISGGWDLQASNPLNGLPMWSILLVGFLIRDFIQWWIHRMLHRFEWLWNFHKVHHSVKEMGFAAHLRYHWMENVVYRTCEYIPLALLGIGLYDFFIIHIFTLAWGHYNHSNISIDKRITGAIVGGLIGLMIAFNLADFNVMTDSGVMAQIGVIATGIALGIVALGPIMKYIFNSPEMHIWHHAHDLPEERRFGVNFGLTLATWDYLFGKAYIPHDGKTIELGFPGIEEFPSTFKDQSTYGIL